MADNKLQHTSMFSAALSHARRRWAIRRMAWSRNGSVRSIGRAILDTERNAQPYPAVEAIRTRLAESGRETTFTDFGAGEPSNPTAGDRPREKSVTFSKVATVFSKRSPWTGLLAALVRHLKPKTCLELGTCVGLSGAHIALALRDNGGGRLVTLEGAETFAGLAKQHFDELGVSEFTEIVTGRFTTTLRPTLQDSPAVDFAFVDGHHDGDATLRYFETLVPHLIDSAVVVFDDVLTYESMKRAWHEIQERPEVTASVDLGPLGLCVVGGPRGGRYRYPALGS